MNYNLKITKDFYDKLYKHLFPGDGCEAAAFCLCGRLSNESEEYLLVNDVIEIPYEDCEIRTPTLVKWSSKKLVPYLEKASKYDLAIVKVHSHPTGFNSFSSIDDKNDLELLGAIYGWTDSEKPHGSLIFFENGHIKGRVLTSKLEFESLKSITVIGDDLIFLKEKPTQYEIPEFALRTAQTFGEGTINILRGLKIGVVGCSGTGSPVIEQLVRLGVGTILLIDPDHIEEKNLNRILNSTKADAENRIPKVEMFKNIIDKIGLGTKVISYSSNLYDSIDNISDLGSCDLIFGCVDSIDGRHLINNISTFYLVPYIDLGVKIKPDGLGGIEQITGAVHYLQPGKSSLITRKVYTIEGLRSSSLKRQNSSSYEAERIAGYLAEVHVESPAVISINMQVASIAINEFLARIHPYRYESNKEYAITRIDFSSWEILHEAEGEKDKYLERFVGRGNMTPPLNMSELS